MAATSTARNYDETLTDIEESLGRVPEWFSNLPEQDLVNEWPTFKRYMLEETEIPGKYRELIGLAIAANIKCPYCQHFHKGAAQLHGATEEELEELFFLASVTARYSSMLHAQEYDHELFEAETEEIAAFLQEQ